MHSAYSLTLKADADVRHKERLTMDMPFVAGLAGAIVGAMATVCVYPFILKRRANKLLAQCAKTTNDLGDPYHCPCGSSASVALNGPGATSLSS